jgi:hypothetical protein
MLSGLPFSDLPIRVSVWMAGLVIAALIMAVRFTRHWLLKQAAESWPMMNATVESFYVINSGAGSTVHWIPILEYSYAINGQRYSGNAGLQFNGGNDKTIAEEAGNTWQGQKILVRYNPQKPEKSVFLVADGAPRGTLCFADQPPHSRDLITLSLK